MARTGRISRSFTLTTAPGFFIFLLSFLLLASACGNDYKDDSDEGNASDGDSQTDGDQAPDGDVQADGDDTPADGDPEVEIPADGDGEEAPLGEILPFQPAGPDSAPDPMLWGPFPVGVTTVDFFDETRPKDDGSPRMIRVEIWYPATQKFKDGPFWSVDFKMEMQDAPIPQEHKDNVMNTSIEPIVTPSVRDADIDTGHGPYPLMVFSHGQNGIRWQSVFYTAHLASHGYIVASWDDEGNTLWELISEGFNETTMLSSLVGRPKDVAVMMDGLLGFNEDPEHFFYGTIDEENMGISGHSLGGITSVMMPCRDARFKITVPHSPIISIGIGLGECDYESYAVPMMVMGGTLDRTIAYCAQYCEYRDILVTQQPKYLYELHDGGHFTFSDICLLDLEAAAEELGIGAQALDAITDGCADFNAPWEAAHDSINYYSTAFINYYLRHSEASLDYLVEREDVPFDNVTFYEGDIPDFWGEGGCEKCEGMR